MFCFGLFLFLAHSLTFLFSSHCGVLQQGDLVTLADVAPENRKEVLSVVTLWNVNGFKVSSFESPERVNCIAISSVMDGVNVNLLVGGLESGAVMIWTAWDLAPIRKVFDSSVPILSVAISSDNSFFLTGNQKGEVVSWGKKLTEKDKRKFSSVGINPPINIISCQAK